MYLRKFLIFVCVISGLQSFAQSYESVENVIETAKESSRFNLLVKNNDYSLARECAENLVVDNQIFLSDYLCNNTLYKLKNQNTKASALCLIRELYTTKNNGLKRLVAPIYYYQLFLNTTKPDSINSLLNEYFLLVNKYSSYDTKIDLYSILIVKRLQTINTVSNETIHSILSQS